MAGRWLKREKKRLQKLHLELDKKRVAVVSPVGDLCHTGYAMSLAMMLKETLAEAPENLEALQLASYGSTILPFSRQVLAASSLEWGATHLLWIDSDMEFPRDMLLRCLRYTHPIVGINAMSRRMPWRNTAQHEDQKEVQTTLDSSGLEKVARMGFGVVWTAAEVFRVIELPWFDFEWVPESTVFRGEDYCFSEKAKAAGFDLYVDHDLSKQVRHLGTFGYTPLFKSVMQQGDNA